jgi:predicted RNA-binding protein with RPS1 domain
MKILVTESQYFKLILEQQTEIEFPEEIIVRYTDFRPDTNNQRTFVYINGINSNDLKTIKELKESGENIIVKLANVHTNEVIDFSINEINLTKASGTPYITIDKFNSIKDELINHEIKLDENFLKKSSSGFPKFMTETLFKLYPNNIGKNSFINGNGVCNSEDGLIDIQGTNVPGQTWSILNYFDTNPMVIKKLIEWYMKGIFDNDMTPTEVTIEEFGKWLTFNSDNLFKQGKYLQELVDLNLKSYDSGTKTENLTIKKLTESPHNINPNNIKQFCSGSKQDRIDGKDLEITLPSGTKYAQVKPLGNVKYNEDTKTYEVYSYQMKNYKNKPLQYIIFTNTKEMVIFENKNYKVEEKHKAIFTSPPLTNIG